MNAGMTSQFETQAKCLAYAAEQWQRGDAAHLTREVARCLTEKGERMLYAELSHETPAEQVLQICKRSLRQGY